MPIIEGTQIGMANRFRLKVPSHTDHDLGTFSKVEGLDVSWTVNTYQTGDQGNSIWIFPGGTKYNDVSLSRVVCEQTESIRKWLSDTSFKHEPHLMTIDLFDESYKEPPLMTWELRNALPKKWSVTGFDAGASKVAVETLVIAHTGFLDDDAQV
jgi:phage tail-like protein